MTTVAVFDCDDIQATQEIGRCIGAALCNGHVLALVGPLGSGKTTLVKGLAAGAGVRDLRQVNSPTFVIINEYEGRKKDELLHIYHIDVYRLRGSGDLEDLGFDEMCRTGAVIVEWADRVEDLMPEDYLQITIEPTGDNSRRLTCTAQGPGSEQVLLKIKNPPDRGRPGSP